jgi:hypothetical protein
MKDLVRRSARLAACGLCLSAAVARPAAAASSDSVVQFRLTSDVTRLSHDMKIAWAGAFNGTRCESVTIAPRTDKFPGDQMLTFKIAVAQLGNLWLKAGDEVKADEPGCLLLVTAQYTDATFTRPATP